jgi:hypothetical protein
MSCCCCCCCCCCYRPLLLVFGFGPRSWFTTTRPFRVATGNWQSSWRFSISMPTFLFLVHVPLSCRLQHQQGAIKSESLLWLIFVDVLLLLLLLLLLSSSSACFWIWSKIVVHDDEAVSSCDWQLAIVLTFLHFNANVFTSCSCSVVMSRNCCMRIFPPSGFKCVQLLFDRFQCIFVSSPSFDFEFQLYLQAFYLRIVRCCCCCWTCCNSWRDCDDCCCNVEFSASTPCNWSCKSFHSCCRRSRLVGDGMGILVGDDALVVRVGVWLGLFLFIFLFLDIRRGSDAMANRCHIGNGRRGSCRIGRLNRSFVLQVIRGQAKP